MRLLRSMAWVALGAALLAPPVTAGTVSSDQEWKALKSKLAKDLGSKDQDARNRAIRKLGRADWPDAVKLLLKMLRTPDVRTDVLEKRFDKLAGFVIMIQKSGIARAKAAGRPGVIFKDLDEKQNYNQYLAEMAEIRRTLNAVGATKRLLVEALGKTRLPEAVLHIVKAAEKERNAVTKAYLVLALGKVPGADAADVVRAALTQESSAWIRTAALEAMAVRGDSEDLTLMLGALGDESWPVRAAAVDAIAKLGKDAFPAAVEPLIAMLETEEGRLKGDIGAALTKLTGGQIGPDAELWRSWWTANKEKLLAGAEGGSGEISDDKKQRGTTAKFYGIPTTSKRIAFVIDLSGSMNEPANVPEDPAAQRERGGATSTGRGSGGAATGPPESDPSRKPLPPDPAKLDVVKKELMRAIWQLPEDAIFALVGYHTEAQVLGRGVMKASQANKADVGKLVDQWVADGGTNIYDALVLALALGQDQKRPDKKFAEGVDTIFLLSDGLPSFGKVVDPDEIVADITERVKTRRVRIHTIWVDTGEGGANPAVKDQAEQGGRFMKELAEKTGGSFVKR